MGLFDSVNFEMPCPKCGKLMDNFQSKDGKCGLGIVEPYSIGNFYSVCPNPDCRLWVDFSRHRPRIPLRDPPFTREEVEAMGFVMTVEES